MKSYRVIVSLEAKQQMRAYVQYIKSHFRNDKAVRSLRDDYKSTLDALKTSAGSIPFSPRAKLAESGLKLIHFRNHQFTMIFRVEEQTAEVVNIYHDLQDYENH